jgi:ferritin heavy chain
MASVSQCRQNYDERSEAAINKQINMELTASYTYQAMAFHFSRDDVALPGFEKYFKHQSDEEREHAEKFMKYQNSRGGRLVFQNVVKPAKMEWQSGQEALEDALGLERLVNQSLLDLHKVAEEVNDPHLQDFIEGEFLTEQVESIKEIGDLITQAKRCGKGLGEYQFDQLTMQKKN